MSGMLDRYYVSWHDKRKSRWWKTAAALAESAPESIRDILTLGPEDFMNASTDQMHDLEEWVNAAGIGDPDISIMDRESERWRSGADGGFGRNFDRAYAAHYVELAMRETLADSEIVVTYDTARGGWFCRLDDADWGQVADTPHAAVEAFFWHAVDGMIDRGGDSG